jgi:hypothetical protein
MHILRGNPFPTVAHFAAYAATLRLEAAGIVGNGHHTRGRVRAFLHDVFTGRDCMLEADKSVRGVWVSGVSADGTVLEGAAVTEGEWGAVFVSSFLRSMVPLPGAASLGCVRELPLMGTADDEEAFFASLRGQVEAHLKASGGPGPDGQALWDDRMALGRALGEVTAFFCARRRYQPALHFFSGLLDKDPSMATHIADIYAALSDRDKGNQLVAAALRRFPDSVPLLVSAAENHLHGRNIAEALSTIQRIGTRVASFRRAWRVVSRVYLVSGHPDLSLLALNRMSVPVDPLGMPEFEELAKLHRVTEPEDWSVPTQWQQDEEEERNPVSAPESVQHALASLPAAKLSRALSQAYDVLIDMSVALGWNRLLELRSRVFDAELTSAAGDGAEEHPVVVKRVTCMPWLDMLFSCLFEDLSAFDAWMREVEDEKTEGNGGGLFAEDHPGLVWILRGHLARRLQRRLQAEQAYKRAAEEGYPRGLFHLGTLYGYANFATEAIIALSTYLYHLYDAEDAETFEELCRNNKGPPEVTTVVQHLVSVKGLQAIRKITTDMKSPHPILTDIILDCVALKIRGFDR